MKCFLNRKKTLMAMLILGVAAALAGVLAYQMLGEDETAARLAGFLTGLGAAIATYSGVWLVWKKLAGERRAQEKEMELGDERGRIINTKASAAMGVASTIAVVVMTFAATVRGDMLYAALGCVACIVATATGIAARVVLGKRI